jgi:two-component system phosphate regulon sensor histidine kinase PhoR
MSRRDLLGVSALPRIESGMRSNLPAESEGESNGAVADVTGLQGSRKGQRQEHAGLPSSVIHELRTPLTSIHGYAQVLQRSLRNDPRATNALSVVVRESTRLSAMLASLSELAELEADDVIDTPIVVEVDQIVDGVVHEATRRDGGAHPIQIEGAGVACCNPTLLSQALLHVLTNATRFSPPGAAVSVTIAELDDQVEIIVANHGIAIDPADDERIYRPFERGANARQSAVRGLGLGLFLAREALMHVGGRINHETRDGDGTAFRIVLPGA